MIHYVWPNSGSNNQAKEKRRRRKENNDRRNDVKTCNVRLKNKHEQKLASIIKVQHSNRITISNRFSVSRASKLLLVYLFITPLYSRVWFYLYQALWVDEIDYRLRYNKWVLKIIT